MRFLLMLLSLIYVGEGVAGTDSEDGTLDISGCSLDSAVVFKRPLDGLPYAGQLLSMSSSYDWSGALTSMLVARHVVQTTGVITKTLRETFSEDWGTLAIPVCHDSFTPANQNGGTVKISNGETSVYIAGIKYLGGYLTINGVGWRFISSQELVDAGFSEGDEVTITIKNSAMAPYSSYTGWGKLLKRAQGVPTIVLTFDDGGSGPWDQLDYTKDKDIKGTIFYPWDYEGLDSKLTVSQLTELKEAGWDIELDGTSDDSSMTGFDTAQETVDALVEGREWLAENELNDYARFFAYPSGIYDHHSSPITKSDVSGEVGSAVVEMGDVSDIEVGMIAEARTFPKGTRVVSINTKKNTVTLDNASLGVGRGGEPLDEPNRYMTFIDDSNEFYTGKLQAKLKEAGFKIGRTTRPNTMYSRYCVGDYGLVAPSRGAFLSADDDPEEKVESWIEDPQTAGTTTILYFHNILEEGAEGVNISIDTYRTWIDKLAEARDAGEIEVLTMQEWWERDCSDTSEEDSE